MANKSLKYPLPRDIDLTEDEVFRNREFHIIESSSKVLPWQPIKDNWIEYRSISSDGFNIITRPTTNSTSISDLYSEEWTTNSISSGDSNGTNDSYINLTVSNTRTSFNTTAGNYVVTYKLKNGVTYTDDIKIPTEYHDYRQSKLYEKLPFSPFREFDWGIPLNIDDLKYPLFKRKSIFTQDQSMKLDFISKKMKYDWDGGVSDKTYRQGGRSRKSWFNSWFTDDDEFEIIIENPNKDSYEEPLILSAYKPYDEIKLIDMERYPWERNFHARSNNSRLNIANEISELRTTWLNTDLNAPLDVTVAMS